MNIFEHLNSDQAAAVRCTEGPLLVIAGAGSGKTRVVTYRIMHLLEKGVPAEKILALTFTNKAAAEMRERIKSSVKKDVLITTFHSLGARILRKTSQVAGLNNNFNIYDDEDVERVLKACIKEMQTSLGAEEELKNLVKAAKKHISAIKNSLSKFNQDHPYSIQEQSATRTSHHMLDRIYEKYQEKLKAYNAVDFDDLLYLPVKILQEHASIREYYQNHWTYLLIDEYQDTNHTQYMLVKHLIGNRHNLCVVGDPDQSIYSWRGANIQNIMNFKKDFAEAQIVALEQNYRSRSLILKASNALISHNENRYEKKLWSNRGEGGKIQLLIAGSEKKEAEHIAKLLKRHHGHTAWNQMVIFYRTHAQSRPFEDRLMAENIPYAIIGGISFYQRREIKDILAFLRMVCSSDDTLAFERTFYLNKRGLGASTLEKLKEAATSAKQALFTYCEQIIAKPLLNLPLRLSAKQMQGLKEYVHMIQALRQAHQQLSLDQLVQQAIEISHYEDYLKKDAETFEERRENLNALLSKAAEWSQEALNPSLGAFLEELSLKANLDEVNGREQRVHLMTLHNGKGLEYDTVFLVGLEEGLLPHANALDSPPKIEEERRLCYVGMTRAKEHLYLSYAQQRYLWGATRTQTPSFFLNEVPKEYITEVRLQSSSLSAPMPRSMPEPSSWSKSKPSYTTPKAQPHRPSSAQQVSSIPSNTSKESLATQKPLEVGDSISHEHFGRGVITAIYQGGAGLTYKIRFKSNNQERAIVAQYARLNKI